MSRVIKRSILLDGHQTSVTLEDQFWNGLWEIADLKNATLTSVVAEIDHARDPECNLSSSIRIFVLGHFRERVSQQHRSVICDRDSVHPYTAGN
ncbi:MAG TPA: ribbon-helix-helix domain-containing protein [Candidatus Paceibacterota bacterium]